MITAMVVMIVMMVCNIGMFLGMKKALKDAKKDKTVAVNEEITTSKEKEEETQVAEVVQGDMLSFSKEEILEYFKKDGRGTLGFLRDSFPEYIVYKDEEYMFVKVEDSLAKNDWNLDHLKVEENGEIVYTQDENIVSHKGIDVSKYQGDIDWKKVKADGIEYAIIRVAYRGYGSGEIVIDELAEKNIKNATKAGIKVGVYFFSQAINEKEAREEVEYIVDIIKDYNVEYPIVFDMEEISGDTARTDKLTPKEKTNIAIAFCEKVKEAGYEPMVYGNIKWFAAEYEISRLEAYDKWFAYYDNSLYFPYKIKMWQYTDKGKVDGITGNVDLNIYVE